MAKPSAGTAIPNQNHRTILTAKSPICSPQLRSVYLHDWWLMKVESDSSGWRLGVGGFSSRWRLGIRVFCSSAVSKRHDTVTLETVDGITITVSGFINRSHTLQNGFPSEVCCHFLYGFPYNWEEYADQSSCEESTNRDLDGLNICRDDGTESNLPISFDDLPVTRVRDLLMTTTGPDYCAITGIIFNDILRKCLGDSSSSHCEPSANINEENACQVITWDSVLDETPRNHERNKVEKKRKDDGSISLGTPKKTKISQRTPCQSKVGAEAPISSKGVATRSMSRTRNLINNDVENPPITFTKCSLTEFPEANGSSDKNGGILSERNTSNVNHAAISTAEQMEVMDTTQKSAVKSSDPLSTAVVSTKPSEPISTRRVVSVSHASIVSEEERKSKKIQNAPSIRKSVRLLAKKN